MDKSIKDEINVNGNLIYDNFNRFQGCDNEFYMQYKTEGVQMKNLFLANLEMD